MKSHDGARRGRPGTLLEAGLAEGRSQASPGEYVGHHSFSGLLRISFNDPASLRAGTRDGGLEKFNGNAFAPVCFGHKQARDRPHGLMIQRLEQARALKRNVGPSRRQCTPPDSLAPLVGEQARNSSRSDHLLHGRPVSAALSGLKFSAAQSPKHTPASAAGTAFAKKLLEIAPPIRRQRMAGDLQPRNAHSTPAASKPMRLRFPNPLFQADTFRVSRSSLVESPMTQLVRSLMRQDFMEHFCVG